MKCLAFEIINTQIEKIVYDPMSNHRGGINFSIEVMKFIDKMDDITKSLEDKEISNDSIYSEDL